MALISHAWSAGARFSHSRGDAYYFAAYFAVDASIAAGGPSITNGSEGPDGKRGQGRIDAH